MERYVLVLLSLVFSYKAYEIGYRYRVIRVLAGGLFLTGCFMLTTFILNDTLINCWLIPLIRG